MKQKLFLLCLLLCFVAGLPILLTGGGFKNFNIKQVLNFKTKTDEINYEFKKSDKVFKVLDKSTGEILTIDENEFMIGAVATEMPPTFEPEALKAQAIAAFTHFSRLREKEKNTPSAELNGADFSVDTKSFLHYAKPEQLKARWGNNFDFYNEKIKKAIAPVLGKTLCQNGKLIVALYHAISPGNTENCVEVFGGDLNYLKSVPSPGDLTAPDYETKSEFLVEDFRNKLLQSFPDIILENAPETWISEIETTENKTVKTIKIGNKILRGSELRSSLGLRSSNFSLELKEGKFIFVVHGYGHGVGMSQHGANQMAKEGKTYDKILKWYYQNTEIC